MVITGLEKIKRDSSAVDGAGRLGLLYNQASVDSNYQSAADIIAAAYPGRLTALFGPQHGATGTEQDNMLETSHGMHPRLKLPLYSLYWSTRTPDPAMLEQFDTILVDIQDVGTRVYTFATTVLYLMRACSSAGKSLVILDRPNPINGAAVEGNLLDPEFASFVGPYPIPMRHGFTLGELANFYNEVYGIGCSLKIVPISGWTRRQYLWDTGLPWVMPSPNMPLVETALVYPGQVILEGTNLSEGRGTTRPFEIFGAPYLDPRAVAAAIEPDALHGAILREVEFKPTFNKWAGSVCRGFQIHVKDKDTYRPYRASLGIISTVLRLYPENFMWSDPPYEYEYHRLPADLIIGDPKVRRGLEEGRPVLELEKEWQRPLTEFRKLRENFMLYRP